MNIYEDFVHTKFGYCYYATGKNPLIFNLYVHPEYRRQGKARKLLQYAINEIRESGYLGVIKIEAKPRDDSISLEDITKFYESLGLELFNDKENEND